jgi:L1 cell adhesion molecule like protein
MSKVVIGIDLGTTYSCVGHWENGKVEIIANDQGNRTTPSYVSFDGNTRLIGDGAKNLVAMNPTNTVYDAKRLIGRKFSDPTIQNDLKYWPFKVIGKQGDKPHIEVNYMDETKLFAPEEISAMVLTKMKDTVEAYLGKKVDGAVITVPAYFNDTQRSATKDAGIIAGLNVLRVINEPTAAAIAYGLDKQHSTTEKNILIFDFGGGTHDITVLTQAEGSFEVKSTSGDTHLGGEDIDNVLTNYCLEDFKKRYHADLSNNPKARRRLQTACEQAKRTLSSQSSASIEIDSLHEGIDFSLPLSRAKYEDLCMPIFRRTITPIDDALRTAKMDKTQIDEVVLIGGSTRIPKVRELLSEYFNGKQLNMSVNPDEAVAYGAAVQAAIINGDHDEKLQNIVVIDATPLTLGVETAGQIMTPMIARGSTIPTRKVNVFSTYSDNQPACTICVYEGERKMTRDCNKLGEFTLSGIPPAPRGIPQIEITYDVDVNGILNVTAMDKMTNKKMSITIKNDRRSKEEIDRMLHEAEKFAEEDKKNSDRIEAKNKLEGYVYQVKHSLTDLKDKMDPTDLSQIEKIVHDALDWLTDHQNSEQDDYDHKKEELEKMINPIMMKMYQSQQPDGQQSGQPQGQPQGQPATPRQSENKRSPKIEEVD